MEALWKTGIYICDYDTLISPPSAGVCFSYHTAKTVVRQPDIHHLEELNHCLNEGQKFTFMHIAIRLCGQENIVIFYDRKSDYS